MNEYKISYAAPGTDMSYTLITERTEAAAQKTFKARYKENGTPAPDIFDIELIREDAPATKQQERNALAAIKKMVEELGPQSYLATAFEGCWADAESNIENDFADSMKARWLHADAQLNAANGTIEELRDRAYAMVGEPDPVQFGDRIVGVIEGRDGTIMDVVREIKAYEFQD